MGFKRIRREREEEVKGKERKGKGKMESKVRENARDTDAWFGGGERWS